MILQTLHWSVWLGFVVGVITVVAALLYTLWQIKKEEW